MNRQRIGLIWMLWVIASGAGAEPQPADFAAFEGAWIRTSIKRDDAAREAEIVRVTESMSSLTRGIARLLLSRRMRPHASLRILCDQADLVMRSEEDRHPMKGRRREDKFRLRSDGIIEQTRNEGADGHGTTILELSPDGRRLFLRISVTHPNFEGPIRYTTTYDRADDAREPELRTCGSPS